MFLSMIKKEFKHFFRSKSDVIMMFVFPIVLITALSMGLKNMMTSQNVFGTKDNPSMVYYTMDNNSKYKDGFISFKNILEDDVNIKFKEVKSQSSAIDDIDKNKAILHVNIEKDGFSIYTSKNGEKTKSKVFRSIFENMLNEYAVYETIGEFNPKAFENLVENKYDEYIELDKRNSSKEVTSSEYYTFAELALIILFVSQVVGESVYKENKLGTMNRIQLSKVKESSIIVAKVMFGVFISILQTILVYFYSSIVLKVNWGDNTLKFILLFICLGLLSSIIGAIMGLVVKRDNGVSGMANIIIFILCLLGGCYMPLIVITAIPVINKVMYLSPIYWVNVATSTMVCNVQSNAYIIALIEIVFLSLFLLLVYKLILRKKEALSND